MPSYTVNPNRFSQFAHSQLRDQGEGSMGKSKLDEMFCC